MKRYVAATLLLLLTAWNAFLAFGCAHDASVNARSEVIYYSVAFLLLLGAIFGLAAIPLILVKSGHMTHCLLIWIGLTAASAAMLISALFSPAGADSSPALFFCLPQLMFGAIVVCLLVPGHVRAFGVVYPALFLVTIVLMTLLHFSVAPAEQVIVGDLHGRASVEVYLELYWPTESKYYLRPFSAIVMAVAWAGMMVKPLVSRDSDFAVT